MTSGVTPGVSLVDGLRLVRLARLLVVLVLLAHGGLQRCHLLLHLRQREVVLVELLVDAADDVLRIAL